MHHRGRRPGSPIPNHYNRGRCWKYLRPVRRNRCCIHPRTSTDPLRCKRRLRRLYTLKGNPSRWQRQRHRRTNRCCNRRNRPSFRRFRRRYPRSRTRPEFQFRAYTPARTEAASRAPRGRTVADHCGVGCGNPTGRPHEETTVATAPAAFGTSRRAGAAASGWNEGKAVVGSQLQGLPWGKSLAYARSITAAAPIPPPIHMLTTP